MRQFLVVKGFNANLVQFLLPYHVISNMHVCSFMCAFSHLQGHTPKMVLHAQNLIYEKL